MAATESRTPPWWFQVRIERAVDAVFHVKHQGWTEAPFRLSPTQAALIDRYEELLRERALRGRMISEGDRDRLRGRHLGDSLRAIELISREDRSALDIGSGAGLPGVVISIARPELQITLVETRRSRAAFLEAVVSELGLANARVVHGRIEAVPDVVQLCFARAFGSAAHSWEAAEPRLEPAGRLIYWAGASFRISDVPPDLRVEVVRPPSLAWSGPLVMMCRQ
jgi:16S rRNA (guanine527-N7)-methyltransferase